MPFKSDKIVSFPMCSNCETYYNLRTWYRYVPTSIYCKNSYMKETKFTTVCEMISVGTIISYSYLFLTSSSQSHLNGSLMYRLFYTLIYSIVGWNNLNWYINMKRNLLKMALIRCFRFSVILVSFYWFHIDYTKWEKTTCNQVSKYFCLYINYSPLKQTRAHFQWWPYQVVLQSTLSAWRVIRELLLTWTKCYFMLKYKRCKMCFEYI